VIVMDERGACREFNPAAERVFGHRREAVIGRQLGDVIVPPHLRAAHAAGLARLLARGESRMVGRRIETVGLRADGSTFAVELAIVAASADGERLFVAHLRDVTERVRAAEALRESEARFHAAADCLADGLAIFDAEGRLAYHNGRFAAHLIPGVRAALAPGKRLEDVVREGMASSPVYH
jgi:PAS domain S-box-containing protein